VSQFGQQRRERQRFFMDVTVANHTLMLGPTRRVPPLLLVCVLVVSRLSTAAQEQQPSAIIVDRDMTPSAGTIDRLTVQRALVAVEDRILPPMRFDETTPVTRALGIGYLSLAKTRSEARRHQCRSLVCRECRSVASRTFIFQMWLRREHGTDARSRDQPRSRRMSLVPMRVMTGQATANRQLKLKPPGTIRSGDAGHPLWESQRPSIVDRDARRRTDTAAGPSPRHSECDLRDST
jgi:hypothetical protein